MIFDSVKIVLTSSDLPARFRYINGKDISVHQVSQKDILTASFILSRNDLNQIRQYLEQQGDEIRIVSLRGPGPIFLSALHRPVLLLALAMLFFLTLWLPTKVLFVQVEGNRSVPVQEILQCGENAGICFGAGTRQVRSEKVKNSLLAQIPGLCWVGVNTRGCVATITVAEREQPESRKSDPMAVSSLVAVRDAQITELTVTAGNALCKPGQIVQKGHVLISGYTDCGIKIQATQASGEVFGQTLHQKALLFPQKYLKKAELFQTKHNLFLQVGKKEIKIWKDSRISSGICDKMYTSYFLTLPGGFRLPLALRVETYRYYSGRDLIVDLAQAQPIMECTVRQYLQSEMISGRILSSCQSIGQQEDAYWLSGSYICQEMIARIHHEEIGAYHEQNDRKDRKR